MFALESVSVVCRSGAFLAAEILPGPWAIKKAKKIHTNVGDASGTRSDGSGA